MEILLRSWRAVSRKPIKSSLLLIILLIFSLFFMVVISVNDYQQRVQSNLRNQVGASFRLEANMDYQNELTDRYWDEYSVLIEAINSVTFMPPRGFFSLLLEDIEEISEVSGVSETNLHIETARLPMNFSTVFVENARHDELDFVTLRSVRNLHLLDEVAHGFITLKEGRWITETDEDVLVISAELAEQNQLSVGDTLEFMFSNYYMTGEFERELMGTPYDEPVYSEATIIGIFNIEQPMTTGQVHNGVKSENVIFSDFGFEKKSAGSPVAVATLATFHVADIDQYEQVRDEILGLDINWARYDLIDANETMERLSGNFSQLERLSQLLFTVVFIGGFLILSLVFSFWIKGRKHEFAIFLSLGISKFKITAQLFCEAVYIMVIAFGASFVIGNVLIRDFQLGTFQDLASPILIGEVPADGVTSLGGASGFSAVSETLNQVQETIQIQWSPRVSLLVFSSLLGIVFLSILVSIVPIIRKKPREILTDTA